MGEHADQIIDNYVFGDWGQCDPPKRYRSPQKGLGPKRWKDHSGRVWEMKDMTTEHITHALRVAKELGNTARYKELSDEYNTRIQAIGAEKPTWPF